MPRPWSVIQSSCGYHSGYSSCVLTTVTLFKENDPDISGFTAIGITDMKALRYCFLRFAEDPNTGSVILTPLSPDRYIKAYESQPRESKDVLKTLCAEFQCFQSITRNDLRRIRPHMNWKEIIQPPEGNENDEHGYRNEIAYDGEDKVGGEDWEELTREGKDRDEDVDKDEDEALQNPFLNLFGWAHWCLVLEGYRPESNFPPPTQKRPVDAYEPWERPSLFASSSIVRAEAASGSSEPYARIPW